MSNYIVRINNIIDNISDDICDYNLKDVFSNINLLILNLSNIINSGKIPKDKINILNEILENVNVSINNKDYQLLSDVLKFQLVDFIKNV